jgi:hypothetical protein
MLTARHFVISATTVVLAALFAGCAHSPTPVTAAAPAQAIPPADPSVPPKAVLWVGNSYFYYNNSMHGHVQRMLADAKVQGTRANSVTVSGAGIDWHDMASHFKPESGMAKYSFNAKNEVVFNKFDRRYDAVIMMDCSQCPIHPTLKPVFYETVKKHIATVRSNGAVPYLFASWAYADQPQMTEQLAAEYVNAAKLNNAFVVPAGNAFANSIKSRADINLYDPDKRHPSLAGTYLGAATVLATVYKVNPTTVNYNAGLPADVAAHLRQVAWDTVQAFKQ